MNLCKGKICSESTACCKLLLSGWEPVICGQIFMTTYVMFSDSSYMYVCLDNIDTLGAYMCVMHQMMLVICCVLTDALV